MTLAEPPWTLTQHVMLGAMLGLLVACGWRDFTRRKVENGVALALWSTFLVLFVAGGFDGRTALSGILSLAALMLGLRLVLGSRIGGADVKVIPVFGGLLGFPVSLAVVWCALALSWPYERASRRAAPLIFLMGVVCVPLIVLRRVGQWL